jgi:apolipoprotein N-acyltransferase
MLAGLLLAAAFPTVGIAGFAWIAPALLLAAARGKSPGDAARVGYVAGLTYNLASLYWLLLIPVTGFPVLGWAALSAFLALFMAVWTWLVAGWGERPHEPRKPSADGSPGVSPHQSWVSRTLWTLGGAAAWVALEMIRARIFGGLPWNLLGVSQYQLTPLIQLAAFTGVYGVSFLVVWVSLALYSAVRAIFSKPTSRFSWQAEIILPLLVVVVLFAAGVVKLRQPVGTSSTLRVTLIQPSVPQTLIWDANGNARRFQELLALTEAALTNQTDLLIWPEAALPEFSDANYIAITNLVRTHRVWMIFNADHDAVRPGAKATNDYDVFNAAYLFDPDGNFASVYDKQNLVMFGEYIPLAHWLPFLKWLSPIGDGFAAGNKPATFTFDRWRERSREPQIALDNGSPEVLPRQQINAAPLICFEDIFPQLARQAVHGDTDLLVNLTNDGWFGHSAQQWEHLANAIFRSVENGVPLVRCCNNGVTCWIDAHGQVRQIFRDATGSVYGSGWMTLQLPLPEERPAPTFYNRHGDWFGWTCVILAAAITVRRIRVR